MATIKRNASAIVLAMSVLILPSFFGVAFSSNLEMSSPSFSRIILFSWDGVQYNHFAQLYNAGNLPNVKKLTNEGILVKAYITDHDTTTNPGHVTLLTGSGGPDVCPDDLTVWEKIEDWNNSWVTGCIAGKSKFSDTIFPSYVYNEVDYWYAGDVYSNVCADLAIDFVESYGALSFFLFVHFRDPDSAGHSYGENSQQYEDALVRCDTQMGRILSALDSQGILNSTAIVLTTDHGFMEGGKGHETSPYPTGDPNTYTTFIACKYGTVEPLGWGWDQNDVAPTLYSLMGIRNYGDRFIFLKGFALWDRAYRLARRYAESFVVNGTAFNVFIVSNSTVSNIAFNQTDKKISFESIGGSFSNVTVPKGLLDEAFLVLIDGVRASCSLTSNSLCSYLFFTYSGDAHEIGIIGVKIRKVGVNVGDGADYEVAYSYRSNDPMPLLGFQTEFANIEFFKTEVLLVEGTNVTFQATTGFKNGTIVSNAIWIDVSGDSLASPQFFMDAAFFISANLTVGDTLTPNPNSYVINATLMQNYAGAEREVNLVYQKSTMSLIRLDPRAEFLIDTTKYVLWDRATGVLVEANKTTEVTNISQSYVTTIFHQLRMKETNIWSPVFVPVDVNIDPKLLNLRSQGKWITGYIELPEGHNVSNTDASIILLNNTVPAEWSDVQDGVLIVKFDKGDVADLIKNAFNVMPGHVTLTISGKFSDGTPFEGSDTVRVTDKQAVTQLVSCLFSVFYRDHAFAYG